MKSATLKHFATILLAGAVVYTVFMFYSHDVPKATAAGPFYTNLPLTATSSAVVNVTTSTRIAATTSSPTDSVNSFTRVYTTICTATNTPVAIFMNADQQANGSTGKVTAWIAAAAGYNACYEMTDRNVYLGSITASTTNQASAQVTVDQYVIQQ